MKKLLLFVLMLLPMVASADKSGKCGDNVYYTYNSTDHTLTIYGEGEIWSNMLPEPGETPWVGLDINDVQSVIIEFGVTSISKLCFTCFRSMTSIIIPNSVTSIGELAFDCCTSLTSISFPKGVISIGPDALQNTPWYKNQPDGVIYVNKLAYSYKGEMPANTHITIKDGTLRIADYAFSFCKNLASVTIPNSVTSIGIRAFGSCTSLTSIKVESGNNYFDSRNNCNAIIDSNNQLIVGCKNTIIPNSVTSIGSYAFYGCSGLTSINIPQNVTSICNYAFCGDDLVYVTLPSNLTSIDWCAFSCKSLTDIYCKAVNVPSANSYAFSNPENITLHVPFESINSYQTTEPWNEFKDYKLLDLYTSEKCSKPTTSMVDGKLIFNCETPNVRYNWIISTPSGTNGRYDGFVILPITLYVFATKDGYLPSDVATYEFSGLAGDVNNDGEVNVADHVKLSDIILNKK